MMSDERRDAIRHPHSGPIWFRERHTCVFAQGWLVEQSGRGAAFLSKGRSTPICGERLVAAMSDPDEDSSTMYEALVNRVEHVHANLSLVAVQLKPIPWQAGAESAMAMAL